MDGSPNPAPANKKGRLSPPTPKTSLDTKFHTLPPLAKASLEQLLIDAWWQETRRIYETTGTKEERQNIRRIFDRLTSTTLLTPPSSKTKRRFLFFKIGDWFLHLYFGLRKNKNVEANKYTYFE